MNGQRLLISHCSSIILYLAFCFPRDFGMLSSLGCLHFASVCPTSNVEYAMSNLRRQCQGSRVKCQSTLVP